MTREEFIARVRYLGWICFQMGANLPLHDVDTSSYDITKERLESLIAGTRIALENPDMTAEDNHNIWVETKKSQGYTYGTELSVSKKTHPSMVPFSELTDVEKRKDDMDILMVKLANKLFDNIK